MAVASNTCVSAFRIGMLKDFLIWVKADLGPWGPVMLVFAYIPLTVLAVPAAVLSLGGGYLFGLPVGFVADSIGATLGATIGRSYVISKLRNYSQFQAVAIASERSGFKACIFWCFSHLIVPAVLLLRLVPLLPFNMLNYLLSVTSVRFGEYVLASWLGMMPTTFGMVYVGTTLKDLSDVTHGWDEVSTSHQVFMSLGFVLSVILIFCITKVAKGALEKALTESAKQQKILGPSMLPIVIVADNSSLDLHKPFVISSTQENERQSLV
ncbi:hypothetical protein V6N12_014121 [Hibiscus sabdariffa]|uniref:VTT domain-containing protein n=1 Tax=Hibiscus sabdariffa TaxID=183260 RepID=A0ABR2DJ76_9ROSI